MLFFTSRIGASEGRLLNSSSIEFSNWEYQNIALAAVAQCAVLVNNLAAHGRSPNLELAACINPLLVTNPASTADVYPSVSGLSLGLKTLQDIFSNDRMRENADLIRYTLGMLALRNKLTRNRAMQNHIRQTLPQISPVEDLESVDTKGEEVDQDRRYQQDHTYEQLANLYQDTISTLSYRIQVQGKAEHLKNELIANKIRALLLAGIRSAVLWYQLGGRRWRLVVYRKRIQQTAGNIRRKLIAPI